MSTHRQRLLDTASRAISGKIDDINVRRDGSAVLLNAGKELMWTGYSPDAELLKGLIVRERGSRAVDLVAGCLPKFYNWGESPDNDRAFERAFATPGAAVHFLEKLDGSNLRPYVHPDSGRVEFATRGMLEVQSRNNTLGADFAAMARQIAEAYYPALLDPKVVGRYTFICELIHPANQIITHYGDRYDLPVIAVIDLATGAELSRAQVLELCAELRLSPVGAYSPSAATFGDAVSELRRAWAGTDLEGMVVSVEHPDWAVPFRLKVKAERYLELMRLKNYCTLRRTRELIEANGISTWEQLRGLLLRDYPQLPEEVQMGYAAHFATYAAWNAEVQAAASEMLAAYQAIAADIHAADQKTFALHIAQHPYRSAFFTLRKMGVERGWPALVEMARKNLADRLGEGLDEPDLSLAG